MADKTYLDLDKLADAENPTFIELREQLKQYLDMKKMASELEGHIKTLGDKIKPKVEELNVQGLLVGAGGVELLSMEGRKSCDWKEAERILKPKQLEKITKKGADYKSLRVMTSEKSIAAARESLE